MTENPEMKVGGVDDSPPQNLTAVNDNNIVSAPAADHFTTILSKYLTDYYNLFGWFGIPVRLEKSLELYGDEKKHPDFGLDSHGHPRKWKHYVWQLPHLLDALHDFRSCRAGLPANAIALVTGRRSNLFVLDLDDEEKCLKFLDTQGIKIYSDAYRVLTQSKNGAQYYFKWDDRLDNIKTSDSRIFGDDVPIDIRGEDGLVFCPPSIVHDRDTGICSHYRWGIEEGKKFRVYPVPEPLIEYLLTPRFTQRIYTPSTAVGGQHTDKISHMRDFLTKQSVVFQEKLDNGTHWFNFERCPFGDHTDEYKSGVCITSTGAYGFSCFHQSCQGFTWDNWKQKLSFVSYTSAKEVDKQIFEPYIPTMDRPPRPLVFALSAQYQGKVYNFLPEAGLGCFVGQPGTGKSSAIGAVIAGHENPNCDTLGFSVSTPNKVVLVDTENSAPVLWTYFWRVCHRAGVAGLQRSYFAGISSFPLSARKNFVRSLFGDSAISFIIIDGIGDLVANVNDSSEVSAIVDDLRQLTSSTGKTVLCSLHDNPVASKSTLAGKGRGHLGSELTRRADFCLYISYDKNLQYNKISADFVSGKCRFCPSDFTHYFRWDDSAGMHVSVDAPTPDELSQQQLSQAYAHRLATIRLTWSTAQLLEHFCQVERVAQKTAEARISFLRKSGVIVQVARGVYTVSGALLSDTLDEVVS